MEVNRLCAPQSPSPEITSSDFILSFVDQTALSPKKYPLAIILILIIRYTYGVSIKMSPLVYQTHKLLSQRPRPLSTTRMAVANFSLYVQIR